MLSSITRIVSLLTGTVALTFALFFALRAAIVAVTLERLNADSVQSIQTFLLAAIFLLLYVIVLKLEEIRSRK